MRVSEIHPGMHFLAISADSEFRSKLAIVSEATHSKMVQVSSVEDALSLLLVVQRTPLVIFDCDVSDADWRSTFQQLTTLSTRPCILLASLLGDEYLQQEVVRLQGFDVLPKAAPVNEMMRHIHFAWFWQQHSRQCCEILRRPIE